MLKVENLYVNYGGIPALHGVSLSVQPDEIVALIGPNGAGKTTTLKTIAGLLRPEEGTITYGSKLLSGMGAAEIVAEGIILIPEGRMIFGSLTVRENLHVGAYLLKDRKQIQEREEFVLDMFPALANRLNQMGETLSGGEQQMLAIGRGLMASPAMLLLDEPSMGLAPSLVESIFQTLVKLHQEGTMVLLVEQNAKLALNVASRAYVMEVGEIIADGMSSELSRDSRVVEAYLG